MKAEHRKELHTNLLADRMGRFLQGMKSGPKTKSMLGWVFAILAVGIFAVWQLVSSATSAQRSSLWVQIDSALYDPPETMADSLEAIAQANKGTLPARAARFQTARLLLQQGLETFASDRRAEAIRKIQRARDLYAQLARECLDAPLLDQEALMSVAKAEEALIGLPKPSVENASEDAATYTFEEAVERYRQLANKYPESQLGKAAAAHVKELEANRESVVALYRELDKMSKELNSLAAPKAKPELPAP